jgi:virginiamycin B lyase
MLTSITAGPDGALWFTGVPGEVGRITTAGEVTEFDLPKILPPAAGGPAGIPGTLVTPQSITAGPDGALWFTLANVQGEVGRITTAGVVTELPVPDAPPPAGSPAGSAGTALTLQGITPGPDGALWFTTTSAFVGRITAAGVVTEYATPNFNPGSTITMGPDGNLWFIGTSSSGNNNPAIGRLTPNGVFTSFAAPGNFHTLAGLTAGPNGHVWFTEEEDGVTLGEQPAIGEINTAGVSTLHAIRQGTTLDPNRGVDVDPQAITTGPDGALWSTELGAIGRITTQGKIEQFPLPTPTVNPKSIATGPDGALWFTDGAAIGRITTTGTITTYPLPANSSAEYITKGPDGNLWFTENLPADGGNATKAAIGRITTKGQIQTFDLPRKVEKQYASSVGNIVVGPDGDLWFPLAYTNNGTNGYDAINTVAIGRVTAKGSVKVYKVFSDKGYAYYKVPYNTGIGPAPDGKLWFEGSEDHDQVGVARISTSGKLGPVIPVGFVDPNTVRLPSGPVAFENPAGKTASLALATRSGIVVTQDLLITNSSVSSAFSSSGYGLTLGPDANLWATGGASNIERISGLNTILGSLDYRHRPRREPDYYGVGEWSNVTADTKPTFAGVGPPGAEVTLWVQKQGDSEPVSIGQAEANAKDGSWTLKSQVKLSNGDYAVTATQAGSNGPPSVLYSLAPDASGNLSNALVIQSARG